MSFLVAVKQMVARKNNWALNKLITTVDVTKTMLPEEIEDGSRDGAYVYGLYLEGARWDLQAGCLEDAFMKELYPKVPVCQLRAILAENEDTRGIYRCPVYRQTERATPGLHAPGTGFVFIMQLETKQPASKWTMAGVAMLLATDWFRWSMARATASRRKSTPDRHRTPLPQWEPKMFGSTDTVY